MNNETLTESEVMRTQKEIREAGDAALRIAGSILGDGDSERVFDDLGHYNAFRFEVQLAASKLKHLQTVLSELVRPRI